MEKLVQYGGGFYVTQDVEDVLAISGYDKIKSGVDYAKIFKTDEKTGRMIAKEMIIDLFQLIAKDIFINFNQFNFPLNCQKYYYWNLFVKMFDDSTQIETGGRYARCVLETSMFACGPTMVKLESRWIKVLKDNLCNLSF